MITRIYGFQLRGSDMLRWICFWSILARQPLIKSKKTRRWRWRRWWGWSGAPWGSSLDFQSSGKESSYKKDLPTLLSCSPDSESSAESRLSTMQQNSSCQQFLRRWDFTPRLDWEINQLNLFLAVWLRLIFQADRKATPSANTVAATKSAW